MFHFLVCFCETQMQIFSAAFLPDSLKLRIQCYVRWSGYHWLVFLVCPTHLLVLEITKFNLCVHLTESISICTKFCKSSQCVAQYGTSIRCRMWTSKAFLLIFPNVLSHIIFIFLSFKLHSMTAKLELLPQIFIYGDKSIPNENFQGLLRITYSIYRI